MWTAACCLGTSAVGAPPAVSRALQMQRSMQADSKGSGDAPEVVHLQQRGYKQHSGWPAVTGTRFVWWMEGIARLVQEPRAWAGQAGKSQVHLCSLGEGRGRVHGSKEPCVRPEVGHRCRAQQRHTCINSAKDCHLKIRYDVWIAPTLRRLQSREEVYLRADDSSIVTAR